MGDQRLTRRQFLGRGVGAVAATGAVAAGAMWLHDPTGKAGLPDHAAGAVGAPDFASKLAWPVSKPRLSIAGAEDGRIEPMVRAAVAGLAPGEGMQAFVSRGDVVLIKPNVGFDRGPQVGATTHPEVLRAVIRLCREAGAAEILVTDNPIESPEACFARSGLSEVAAQEGAKILIVPESRFDTVVVRRSAPDFAKGEILHRWPALLEPVRRADRLIGIAPIKDHNLSSASITLKNWYGLLGGRRNQFHQAIHEVISDLGFTFRPTLVFADGVRAMLRNGPTGGRPSDVAPGGMLGRPVVAAAVDPVACDAWAYETVLGRDPAQLQYLHLAERKLGRPDASWSVSADWHALKNQGLVVTTGA